MYFSYFDESGDDGFNNSPSPLFILTSIYFHQSKWKSNYDKISHIRKSLKQFHNLPVKQEFHTKESITDKEPYHGIYTHEERKSIFTEFVSLLSVLEIKIISVVINKSKITRPKYNILKNALTYNVQRIENDLNSIRANDNFIIITDEGRIGKMRSITREMQKINYIPSHFTQDSYRKEIQYLLEDPLEKNSAESYFIQVADMLSFLISLYAKQNLTEPKIEWSKRIRNLLNYGDEIVLLNRIKDLFNLQANKQNEYGVVCYPK